MRRQKERAQKKETRTHESEMKQAKAGHEWDTAHSTLYTLDRCVADSNTTI